ncbi:DegT/DnrJ/EryC1/StrS aminotransferase [Catenovulum agarivorans DS-2]|uniref:DegT/DnrJ/EryC1/StrS aminotransferase n=1 Tax=Catenovulum agarivorans DS-2 TaxID=1328313 RepID=W7Q9G9_9ALTE|nr:UDP-4-amino-4,6-dideoxy-N-acetyl-beta-L-altrosamine transaminase [Catenovulum agarivorans]EWH09469.1 DegT/DnrJ/EryC1/StrS aminotransferase [Catenovulum agarivorans DS-2]
MIPYGKHHIDQSDIDAVVDVLRNQFLTQGQQVPAFEQALCAYTNAHYALAVNSATSALHLACLALGVTKGDVVWTTPITFVATANCIRFCHADVDFVDINPSSRNICPLALKQKLQQAAQQNKLPKALIVVHFAGFSCDMQAIADLCKQFNVKIIEDACHALGGVYSADSSKIGHCQYADFVIFSFHPVKSITTAEGGALLTNDKHLLKQATLFAKHGVTRDAELMQGEIEGPWSYQQLTLGYNYRMSDMQAALGISQLNRLDSFIQQRRLLAKRYFDAFAELEIQARIKLPNKEQLDFSAWHLFAIELNGQNRLEVYNALLTRKIQANVHYSAVHLQPYYQQLGFKLGDFPNAETYAKNTLTLPLYQTMTIAEQDYVIEQLMDVLCQNPQ